MNWHEIYLSCPFFVVLLFLKANNGFLSLKCRGLKWKIETLEISNKLSTEEEDVSQSSHHKLSIRVARLANHSPLVVLASASASREKQVR
jgi:hypothetical protein